MIRIDIHDMIYSKKKFSENKGKFNKEITNVNLRHNNIGATGATSLVEAFKVNSKITKGESLLK